MLYLWMQKVMFLIFANNEKLIYCNDEEEEELSGSIHDDYNDEKDVDIYPVQGESSDGCTKYSRRIQL